MHDPSLGEFAIDLGGEIPLAVYDLLSSYWYPRCGGMSIRNLLLQNFLDYADLQNALSGQCGGTTFGNPIIVWEQSTFADGDPMPVNNHLRWGDFAPGTDDFQWISGDVNGGIFQATWRPNIGAVPPRPINLVLFHPPYHGKDLMLFRAGNGTNAGTPQYGVDPSPPFDEDRWPKDIADQAINIGDVVIGVVENTAADPWIMLLRSQEIEHYFRQWFPGYWLAHIDANQPIEIKDTFIIGISYGGVTAPMAASLQPRTYSGTWGYHTTDLAYARNRGDYGKMQGHRWAGFNGRGWEDVPATIHNFWFEQVANLFVDNFETRPTSTQQLWGIQALSLSERLHRLGGATELKVPAHGILGDCDLGLNFHWMRSDFTHVTNGKLGYQVIQGATHGDVFFVINGKNEYSVFDETELADLKGAKVTPGPGTTNPPLIPSTPLPKESPDPYSHTLRHVHCPVPCPSTLNLLTDYDLNPDGDPANVANLSIGNGIWPGFQNTLRMGELLGTPGTAEVWFGNFDGFFHVLRFKGGAIDKYRLDDLYKSPGLGWGVFANDRGTIGGQDCIVLGDSLGNVYKVAKVGATLAAPVIFASSTTTPALKKGLIPQLFVGNFVPGGGNEVLVMNEECDWLLFNESGVLLTTLLRSTPGTVNRYANTPGLCQKVDIGLNGDLELVMGAMDGFVHEMDYDVPTAKLVVTPVANGTLGFSQTANLLVQPIHLEPSEQFPSHILALGVRASPTDGKNNRVVLVSRTNKQVDMNVTLLTGTETDRLESNFSFAFTKLTPTIEFVVGFQGMVKKFRLNYFGHNHPSNGAQVLNSISFQVKLSATESQAQVQVSGLAYYSPPPLAGLDPIILVSLSNGRIFALKEDLTAHRTSRDEDPSIPLGQEFLWYSNESFGHVLAADLVQGTIDIGMPPTFRKGDAHLYLADYDHVYWDSLSGPDVIKQWRVTRVDVPAVSTSATLKPRAFDAEKRVSFGGGIDEQVWRLYDLRMFDATPGVFADPDFSGEGWDAFFDYEVGTHATMTIRGLTGVRHFTSITDDFGIMVEAKFKAAAGFVFEWNAYQVQTLQGGFQVPIDPDLVDYPFEGNPGTTRYTGQVSGQFNLAGDANTLLYFGHGMDFGSFPRSTNSFFNPSLPWPPGPHDHVFIGTVNGFVYGIIPANKNPTLDITSEAYLSYASDDLGWMVVGLDVGDVDPAAGDGNEVVAGTWLDKGTKQDWINGNLTKNRGHLYIFKPNAGNGHLDIHRDLTGDDLLGVAGSGLGSGVFGVKIDDVDADGKPEIWCTDATGHVYLFHYGGTPADWRCLYRSRDLGTYPGNYNTIFPVKDVDEDGDGYQDEPTVRLVVVSSGYVYCFNVDFSLVP